MLNTVSISVIIIWRYLEHMGKLEISRNDVVNDVGC